MAKEKRGVTGSDLFDFAQCNHRVYLNAHGNKSDKVKLDPATERLLEDGVLHEEAVIGDFKYKESKAKTSIGREQDTAKYMQSGVELIYHGLLSHGHLFAEPDFLKKTDVQSKFGSHSYVPVEIKNAKKPSHEQLLQLYYYCYMLELIQGTPPDAGYIVNAEKEWIEVKFGADERTLLIESLSVIEQIHQQKWTKGPTLVSHCKKCPWQKHCLEYMKLNEDVSLVHRLGKTDKGKMHEAGIMNLTKLAGISLTELEQKVTTIPGRRLARYRIQAEALKTGNEILLKDPKLALTKKDVYLDLEIESSFDVCYLFGLLIDDGKKDEFIPILAKKPKGEKKAWEEFQDFLEALDDATPIYHWAKFEVMWMNKLSTKYGVSQRAAHIIENNFVDLHKITEDSIAFPLSSYSLKDVARHLGFDWRDEEIGGALSMLWYLEWLEKKDKNMLNKILRYNEDDVRATKYVKDWLVRVK